jgi:7,8-dihydropterin-6-yl-methyl-4-(beta-D-ribofuranosyl)aminobenzene 5'-phosphate synthase
VPTPTPSVEPSRTSAPELTVLPKARTPVTFTIVYDNNSYDPELQTAWGFACLVETGEATVLFDTGGDGPTLLGNMAKLGIDPLTIETVVLSHIHGDHVGGLTGLLDAGTRPTVYVPDDFPASFKNGVSIRADLVEVTGPMEIGPGLYTTGQVGSAIVEQALAVETADGLVVVTGCAHPGVVEMVDRASAVLGGDVLLVMGGFHLGSATQGQIGGVIDGFRRLGVRMVAPCHCTGDRARQFLAESFGSDCITAGVGRVITFERGATE